MGITLKDLVDSRLDGLNKEGQKIAAEMFVKYESKETLNEIGDDGRFVTPLLFPNFLHFLSAVGMLRDTQVETPLTVVRVIDYQLVFLHQTPEGKKELGLLNEQSISDSMENAAYLYIKKKLSTFV